VFLAALALRPVVNHFIFTVNFEYQLRVSNSTARPSVGQAVEKISDSRMLD